MAEVKKTDRGLDARKMQVYADAYAKEDHLRLKWFRKNEERLVYYSEQPLTRTVPKELLNEMTENRQACYQNAEKFTVKKVQETPPVVDPNAVLNVMKPFDPAIKKLIYTGTQKDGRINYLNERVKTLPENRYYFPETSSYVYGWDMWTKGRTAVSVRYGRVQVLKGSFYRRNGVARDPDWYQEPMMITPTSCGCI